MKQFTAYQFGPARSTGCQFLYSI